MDIPKYEEAKGPWWRRTWFSQDSTSNGLRRPYSIEELEIAQRVRGLNGGKKRRY